MSNEKIHEVGKEFYHFRSEEEDFHRNVYLKRFMGEDGKIVSMLFDPGTRHEIPQITEITKKLIGGLQNLDLIFLSHQDPDITASLGALLTSAPKSRVISAIDTWRLIRTYGIPENRFLAVENFRNKIMRIAKTGHRVQFVPAYFCHFRGAVMFYDFESQVLFSGDFLAGLNSRSGNGVWATEESWEGISVMHQIYMPTRDALQETINKVSMLNPMPEVIAPQHGDVIKGDLVVEFLTRMMSLEVGLELLKKEEPQKELTLSALNAFLDYLGEHHPDVQKKILDGLKHAGSFTTIFMVSQNSVVDLKVSTNEAIKGVWDVLTHVVPADVLHDIKPILLGELDQLGVTVRPDIFGEADEAEELFA
ncbi:MAG: MBL fold metallo-hydrolase [Deltaproteobacteria bacterium]|nr:MBL fold metallo-hydrolase [Candidatus Zymogenaceae bacterium]